VKLQSKLVGFIAVVLFCLSSLVVAMLLTSARSAVNWQQVRAVAIESDDWGLAGFTPSESSWRGVDRKSLQTGRFPEVYWNSTLEDSLIVSDLVELMTASRGRDNIAAVFQANYVMSSMHRDTLRDAWIEYELPNWPPQYQRPGIWQAIESGRAKGVWRAEHHSMFHYDPEIRRQNGMANAVAKLATERGIMLFPGSEGAREWAPWRLESDMRNEWERSLDIFDKVFGRAPKSVIAADYTWHGWVETVWTDSDIQIIQAKREQRNPLWTAGKWGRLQKLADRQWTRLWHPERIYLERNCHLEPVQAPDPQKVAASCLLETVAAWRRGEPAIVESHRVNFSHTDARVRETGLSSMREYLGAVTSLEPKPTFLCDSEIAQLSRRGTSWRRFGDKIVLRNLTHGTRVVVVPSEDGGKSGQRIYRLAGGEVQIIKEP
jgi:hypothetical protein